MVHWVHYAFAVAINLALFADLSTAGSSNVPRTSGRVLNRNQGCPCCCVLCMHTMHTHLLISPLLKYSVTYQRTHACTHAHHPTNQPTSINTITNTNTNTNTSTSSSSAAGAGRAWASDTHPLRVVFIWRYNREDNDGVRRPTISISRGCTLAMVMQC